MITNEVPKNIKNAKSAITPRPFAEANLQNAPAIRRPMAQAGPKAVRRAQAFGWKSPEAAAVVVASFVVSLCCFYIAAYAKVTSEGIESARVQADLKDAARDKEALEAEVSRLTLPPTVRARAVQMGMVKTAPQTVRLVMPAKQAAP